MVRRNCARALSTRACQWRVGCVAGANSSVMGQQKCLIFQVHDVIHELPLQRDHSRAWTILGFVDFVGVQCLVLIAVGGEQVVSFPRIVVAGSKISRTKSVVKKQLGKRQP